MASHSLRCVERCLPDSTLQRNPGACALTVPKRMQTQPRRHVNRWSCFGHVPSRGKASRWRGRPSAIPACTRTVQVAKPLRLGSVQLQTPLVLAPMAGITSAPFRQLCARYGAELCVSELIIASTLLQRTPAALHLARWAKGVPCLLMFTSYCPSAICTLGTYCSKSCHVAGSLAAAQRHCSQRPSAVCQAAPMPQHI